MNLQLFPSVKKVAAGLRGLKMALGKGEVLEVRLQVYETEGPHPGAWALRTGDSQYDLDHRGWWGAGEVDKTTNCTGLARDLVDQCREHASTSAG